MKKVKKLLEEPMPHANRFERLSGDSSLPCDYKQFESQSDGLVPARLPAVACMPG